jgi:SAM-dependent methyltransferase
MTTLRQAVREIYFDSDEQFNKLFPVHIQNLAKSHWTKLDIITKAVDFLAVDNQTKILDIGSGVGKFCLAAAWRSPHVHFFGIEQRRTLYEHSLMAQKALSINNVTFIHGNFTQLELKDFDHFYFYNSFYENIVDTDKIDDSIECSLELFNYYHLYLLKQLEQKKSGTRVCTLCSFENEIPADYHEVGSAFNDHLKFWVKI